MSFNIMVLHCVLSHRFERFEFIPSKKNTDEGTPDLEPTNSEAINISLKENESQTGVLDIP